MVWFGMDRRASRWLAYWPHVARGIGLALGVGELIAWACGVPPSPGVMTFAAGLLVIPNVVKANGKAR